MNAIECAVAAAVQAVLARASQAEEDDAYLTAYEILAQLPVPMRAALVERYGRPGTGEGKTFTAVSLIGQLARESSDYDYIDARGLAFEFHEGAGPVGFPEIGLYRARRGVRADEPLRSSLRHSSEE